MDAGMLYYDFRDLVRSRLDREDVEDEVDALLAEAARLLIDGPDQTLPGRKSAYDKIDAGDVRVLLAEVHAELTRNDENSDSHSPADLAADVVRHLQATYGTDEYAEPSPRALCLAVVDAANPSYAIQYGDVDLDGMLT